MAQNNASDFAIKVIVECLARKKCCGNVDLMPAHAMIDWKEGKDIKWVTYEC